MISFVKKNSEVIRYLIIGVLTTVVSLIVYYSCVYTFLDPSNLIELQIANVISWIASVIFAFFTNRSFVFKSDNKIIKEALSFTSSRVFTLLIDMLLMFTFVTLLKFNDKLIKLIIQFVVIVLNYILSKLFVFNKK